MSELFNDLSNINTSGSIEKSEIVDHIRQNIEDNGYTIVEQDDKRPWGAFFKFDRNDADRFVSEFFNGLSPENARLGNKDAELSPKILLVSPGQRLSWQYHNRRCEKWAFLTEGAYNKSMTDDQGEVHEARIGDTVQFAATERHRLVGRVASYALVAEIWQHTDANNPSNEDDNIRLQDDYNRKS